MTTKKNEPDMVAQFLAKEAAKEAESTTAYTPLQATQLLDRIVVDAMVTKILAKAAIKERDVTSNKSRQRVGIALANAGINLEAFATALDQAEASRHRG